MATEPPASGGPAERPSRYGVGPHIAAVGAGVAAAAVAAHVAWYPLFALEGAARMACAVVGAVLVAAGLVAYVPAARRLHGTYGHGELLTDGAWARSRHPIYAAWIFLIVPGVALVAGSWALLAPAGAMYLAARVCVRREEAYLEARFGEAYRAYRRRTWPLIPKPW